MNKKHTTLRLDFVPLIRRHGPRN